MVIFIVLKNIS